MAAKRSVTETTECYMCPLCAKPILHQKVHLTDYHNFNDAVALQNFISSNHFNFEKVLIQVEKDPQQENVAEIKQENELRPKQKKQANECKTKGKREILRESAKKKSLNKSIPHHR